MPIGLPTHLEGGQASRVAAIHGNKGQSQREKALAAFKDNKIRVLVATDIAARGIDVDLVTHVVNYELPDVPESYVHRIGRTARAGAAGVAIALVDHEERGQLRDIERLTRQSIPAEDRRDPNARPQQRETGRPESRQRQGQRPGPAARVAARRGRAKAAAMAKARARATANRNSNRRSVRRGRRNLTADRAGRRSATAGPTTAVSRTVSVSSNGALRAAGTGRPPSRRGWVIDALPAATVAARLAATLPYGTVPSFRRSCGRRADGRLGDLQCQD